MYERRIVAFLAIIGAVLVVLAGRLFVVQVLQADDLLDGAEVLLRKTVTLPAVRGKILDRNGLILAYDEPCYDLCLDFRMMICPEGYLSAEGRRQAGDDGLSRLASRWIADRQRSIAKQAGCTFDEAGEILRRRWEHTWTLAWQVADQAGQDLAANVDKEVGRIRKMTRDGRRDYEELHLPHPVVSGLGQDQAAAVQAGLGETVGMEVQPSHARKYPRGPSACHVIGFTGPVTREELDDLNPPAEDVDKLTRRRTAYLPNDTLGKTGVELMCEPLLKGVRGYKTYRAGEEVGESVPAEPGSDIHLTLDADLQEAIEREFHVYVAEKGLAIATGAVVVVDVPTGEILALVSQPGHDLNTYRDDYPGLVLDEVRVPLRSRAITQCYAPGSTAKPLAALAALAEGRITPETIFDCEGGVFPRSADGKPHCWIQPGSHHEQKLVDGLRNSCNVYFAGVGDRLGPARLCQWYRLFGYGSLPGTGLPNESAGVVPDDEWMLDHEDRRMSLGDAWNMAIGQGSLLASPLQVADAMAAIARGGQFVSPVICRERDAEQTRNHLPLSETQIAAVREGMRQVVHDPHGTAHSPLVAEGLNELGFEFCGKSGTAQVTEQKVDLDDDGVSETVVRDGDVVWFAGFAPARGPSVAFAVMIEYVHQGGSAMAAPLALRTLRLCKEAGHIPAGS